jgi:hypothetical protein
MTRRVLNPLVKKNRRYGDKSFPHPCCSLRVLREVFFLCGLGWIYGVIVQLTNPLWLFGGLSHLTPWIRLDTFTIISFLLSILGFFVWRLIKGVARS